MNEEKPLIEIEAKNFGPIIDGNIKVKPLTVFIGPNNSGKSYAAMLISSLFETYLPNAIFRDPIYFRNKHRHFRGYARSSLKIVDLSTYHEFKTEFMKFKKDETLEFPKELLESILKQILIDIYENKLCKEIMGAFNCSLNDLITNGKDSFSLKIEYNTFSICLKNKNGKLKIKEYSYSPFKVIIRTSEMRGPILRSKQNKNMVYIDIDSDFLGHEDNEKIFDFIISELSSIIINRLFEEVSMPHYYLPAARSGIMQGYKALVGSILKNAPYFGIGIERLEIPKFSGIVSDFLSFLIQMPEKEGPFFKMAQKFEKEIIKGNITFKTLDDFSSPEINYSFQDMEIPLHRSSSTVSELAPIFIYLEYMVAPGTILIIEEPEAHLHPKNQRLLAQLIIKLIRQDVRIIITTHSEYLLEQFDNFIDLSKLKEEKRTKYGYDKNDYLNINEISIYSFSYNPNLGGNIIKEVEVDEEEGISHEEFIKVKEMLYEESFLIQKDLGADD